MTLDELSVTNTLTAEDEDASVNCPSKNDVSNEYLSEVIADRAVFGVPEKLIIALFPDASLSSLTRTAE